MNSINGGIQGGSVYGSGAKPVFESVGNFEGGSFGGASHPAGPSNFGTGFGASGSGFDSGSFHSTNPDYYKKALKGGSGINSVNNYGGLYSNGANYESSRQDNFDCVCVPYDQCPARDVLGRKGDLILPLDPRNLGSEIEAEEANATSNANVTRVAKEISQSNNAEDEKAILIETTYEDVKHVTKRDVSEKRSDVKKADGEAVSILLFIDSELTSDTS